LHSFTLHVNPHLGRLLSCLNMDKVFVRGEGCYLYDSDGRRYLDLIASYGALPFGHNPPEVWDAICDLRRSGEPTFIQPSYLEAAGELARRLLELSPECLTRVTFANSGAEAVEAGIKLARAATGRKRILAAKNSFHGKTLGALSATGKETYQKAFGAPVEGFDFISYGDITGVTDLLTSRGEQYAAFILEPIQGEGGIIVPPPGYLRKVRDLCTQYGVLLVLDEVQTGVGRTGDMFACEEEGVCPDVMLLAKALGGGIVPIGAVLSTEQSYTEDFALKHSSTFAGNALACRAGLATLDLLVKNERALLNHVKSVGAILKQGLIVLQNRYPEVIKSVRGRGLMLGIEFGVTRDTFPESLIGVMAEQEVLTPVLSSHLLNVQGLRVAPTLNGSSVIRIEPPLIISEDQCRETLKGLDEAMKVLSGGNTAELLQHFVSGASFYLFGQEEVSPARSKRDYVGNKAADFRGERSVSLDEGPSVRQNYAPRPYPGDGRFAFLVHPVSLENYPEFDRSLDVFSKTDLEDIANRWNDLVRPFVLAKTRIVSSTGAAAYGEFIAVPKTADDLLHGDRADVISMLKEAVELAKDGGAKIVGLGAYTSVVSQGGRRLLGENVAITTGNSYTVVSAVEAVLSSLTRLEIDPAKTTVSVIGATGSIGRATAILLSEDLSRLVLVGNPKWPEKSKRRLFDVAVGICKHVTSLLSSGRIPRAGSIADRIRLSSDIPPAGAPDEEYSAMVTNLRDNGSIVLTTDTGEHLTRSNVIVTATSSLADLVTPSNVPFGAVVLDLSRPPNVSRKIRDLRPDVLVIDGGVVALPGLPSFEPGLAYACMAETIMLGLEQSYRHISIGADLNMDDILYMKDLAKKHGLTLANLRSFDRPLTDDEWERVINARRNNNEPAASLL
jgi:acetylornithine/succinyldiaminopimelate/putrescine aminotransferase/predicted amino acid dehydrogenase